MPTRPSDSHPRVALIIESSRGYGRGLLAGISHYARDKGPWSIFWQDRGLGEAVPDWLKTWKGDGIIARIETEQIRKAIEASGLPAVDLRAKFDLPIPQIDTDNIAVAKMAAAHLRERGFTNLAYCGFGRVDYSLQRQEAFEAIVREAGLDCHLYPPADPASNGRKVDRTLKSIEQQGILFEEDLAHWVESLPKPIGIFACNDMRGQQLLNACRDVNVAVPDRVAVVGVDNDWLLCDLCDPPLSSVAPDTERIGYEAAKILERMMQGQSVPNRDSVLQVPPKDVVVRQSTDVVSIEDDQVARAMQFIREKACDGINVGDVVEEVDVSQGTLNKRFAALIGRSPKHEILRVRVKRASELLENTDLTQDHIARACGFRHAEYMHVVFNRELGHPPGQIRRPSTRKL